MNVSWMILMTLTLAAVVAGIQAEHTEDAAPVGEEPAPTQSNSALSTLHLPGSLTIPNQMMQALAMAGAVVVGLIGATAVLAITLPLFGFRLCYLFGTCEPYPTAYLAPSPYDAYAYSQPLYASTAYAKRGGCTPPYMTRIYGRSYDGAANEVPYAYDPYQQQSYTNVPNVYQKRSLEYVGPILKMLSNAYEKYNHPAQTKTIEKSTVTAAQENKSK